MRSFPRKSLLRYAGRGALSLFLLLFLAACGTVGRFEVDTSAQDAPWPPLQTAAQKP